MESTTTIQQSFFQHIKTLLPPHLSMVDEIAELLNISNDSAYRRIRSEKPLTIDEMAKLATHFKLSLDKFLHLESDSFIFSGKLANASDHIYEKWLENTLLQVQFMASFQNKHVYYIAKDIPLMQQFLVPELTAFKSFFWRKSILHYDELKGAKFSLKNIDSVHLELAKKIVDVYNQVPSTDIWNIESINSTIRQIEFYREAHAFDTEEDVQKLYAAVFKLIDHIEKQAELGLKFSVDGKPASNAAAFNLFNNELILGDNTVMAVLDSIKVTFLNHSVINYVATRDERFNAHIYDAIQNLIKKSTQLSSVGEKERTRFFNRIRDKMKLAARL
jgi:hypothetical protein